MARVFLLPIGETEKRGSYPFQYESTKRSVIGGKEMQSRKQK
jgi:hypothetical protein